ncbi:MAG: YegS/Rv2252/BmrU family lipid kinase [Clostridiales bacterium]
MNKKMLFLFNPKAGKSSIKNSLSDILNIFTVGGYDLMVHPSQAPMDMEEFVTQRGKEFDVIVTCGGDGSLNETINGLMQLDNPPPLGYIPTGTMNDFAASHNISKNMLVAAKDIVRGKIARTDIGKFNDHYFSYVAAFGAFTDVSYGTPQESKNVFGKNAYILEGIKRIPTLASYHIILEYEDKIMEDDFIYGMMSNSISIGGMKMAKKTAVSMNDGYFEVNLVKKELSDFFNATTLLGAVISLDLINNKSLFSFKAQKITVRHKEGLSWTLDGEFGGVCTEAVIESKKEALEIFVP